ncbi:MAG: CPBP family intramembrane metalloprotease [Candidatus Diapherotrites archaeon]|nr:CPBP family intramembrane metalloprotease [Candidatus Diapherotrites archaeon]
MKQLKQQAKFLATYFFENYFGLPNLAAGLIAMVIQSGIFALFHYRVFGNSIEAIVPSFVFGIIATLGCYLFKSLGFEIGLHGINNLRATGLI